MTQQRIISIVRDALSETGALTPGNLNPATDVMVAVLFGMDTAQQRWNEAEFPGEPSVTDYAKSVVAFLEKRYLS